MNRYKIAILGSTSHIAKGLIRNFLKFGDIQLTLFSRSEENTQSFIDSLLTEKLSTYSLENGYSRFHSFDFDVIINCVGVGASNKLNHEYYKWFTITEEFDNLALSYLSNRNPQAIYISLSSGAVYGRDFYKPVNHETIYPLRINDLDSADYYGIARINAETKHRAFNEYNIIDLRIFSYFSRYIDLTDTYLLTELIKCVQGSDTFLTNDQNIIRDYLHPDDLYRMVRTCINVPFLNKAYDMSSLNPVDKWAIIQHFQEKYGLQVEISSEYQFRSGTGSKEHYYSIHNAPEEIGFKPTFSSLQTVVEETEAILSNYRIRMEVNNETSSKKN